MANPDRTPAQFDRSASHVQENMSRALQQNLHKVCTLISRAMETDDPKVIHDTRVACRRLQQRLSAFFPKPRSNKIRKLGRGLRRIRRLLGEWRNCDVLLAVVDSESKATDSPAKAAAWEVVRDHLIERRSQQIRRCRRKLEKYDQPDFIAKWEKVLTASPDQEEMPLLERARDAENAAREKWQAALSQAARNYAPEDLHAFRVATKRLRYRLELVQQLGDESRSKKLELLKTIQDLVGKWHDRQSLQVVVADALGQPALILRDPHRVSVLLQELDRIQLNERKDAQAIIDFVHDKAGLDGPEAKDPAPDLAPADARDLAQQSEPRNS